MQRQFAAVFSKAGTPLVRPSTLAKTLAHVETGLLSMRAVVAPHIARLKKIPLDEVRGMLEISVPIDVEGRLGAMPLEFGGFDPARPGFDFDPRVPALFWQTTARIVREASKGFGDVLSASGAEAFVGAAHVAAHAECGLALSHRRPTGDWVRDVDVVRVAGGLEVYAEKRKRSVLVDAEVLGQLATMTIDPVSFTLKTPDRVVRVVAHARDEESLRSLWGRHVIVRVRARINRDGEISDARLLEIEAVRSAKDPLAYFRATSGKGGGLWSTPEAREYIRSLRGDPEED